MNKAEFDHAIRAAGSILGESDLLVIGSQAAHGSISGELPPEAQRSVEVDVAAFDDPDGAKSDLVDGSIGEASMFHEAFGIYVQGVSETTAILPEGWRDRLVRYESPATNGVVAWCLDLHDLWIAKAVAGRPKDIEFCGAFLAREFVDPAILRQRLAAIAELAQSVRDNVLILLASASDS
ncbi:MAG TPA: hypothetical protein ENH00_05480 [Actinobacteria bacterium]|nr:hypothetical protein [Actinomycetota bacterium]